MNTLHVKGILIRNLYLLRRSWHRWMGLFYWTTLELFVWGFITVWLKDISKDNIGANIAIILLGGLIFWHLFTRAQQTITIGFLEDIWSRNVMNIFTTPLTLSELVAGLITLSVVEGLLSFLVAILIAWGLYAFYIWDLGLYIAPFFVSVFLFGWAMGLVTIGLIVRFGPSVEILAWSIPTLFYPLSAVFYPASVLSPALQTIASFLPTFHLFEGMRVVLLNGIFPADKALTALGLSTLYFILALLFLAWMLRLARRLGLLARLVMD